VKYPDTDSLASRRAPTPSVILSQHSRYKVTCECNEEDINDDDEKNYEHGGGPPCSRATSERRGDNLPESQGHNMALAVLSFPCSLDSGACNTQAPSLDMGRGDQGIGHV